MSSNPPSVPPAQDPPKPPTPPPAGDPKPPAAPPPQPPAPPEPPKPVTYELKLPDGSLLDPQDIVKVEAFAKANNLTNAQAQQLLEQRHEAAAGLVQRQQAFLTDQSQKWLEEIRGHPELGGTHFAETTAYAKRVMQRFGSEGLTELLESSGLGNHPKVVEFVVKIGKALGEDLRPLPFWATAGQQNKPKSDAEVFWPEMPTKTKP